MSFVSIASPEEKLKEIIPTNQKLTFLVGAGISMDKPSLIPSALGFVDTLIRLGAPDEEVDNILSLEGLRYELIVELIQQNFDPDLKMMDYIDLFTEPNMIHYFMANSIKNGSCVITTNFDYLIEYALIKIVEEKTQIVPIITKEDFLKYRNPLDLIKAGKFPLLKIHGSNKNIITCTETKATLITTLSSLGREREEGETFAIESYKKSALFNCMKNSTLIIMGYSGSDDFDIGPTLKQLHGVSKIIWLNHTWSEELEILKFEDSRDGQVTAKEDLLLKDLI